MHFQISVQWFCCIWFHNVSDRLLLKRSCLELKSRALACGIVQDSTRCAGCWAVKRTDWTCPLFRFFPFVHWLCRAVDRGEGGGGVMVVYLSESWQGNYDILVLKQPRFWEGAHDLARQLGQGKMVISQPQGRASMTSEFTTGLLYPNLSQEVSCWTRTKPCLLPQCLFVSLSPAHLFSIFLALWSDTRARQGGWSCQLPGWSDCCSCLPSH